VKNCEQGKSDLAKISPIRVFFAIWPDEKVRTVLHELARERRGLCGGRVMRAETLHLTLLFLGDIPVEKLPALQQAVSAVHVSTFRLELNRFASWRHNAIGYAAPTIAPEGLLQLVLQLREYVAEAGFQFDGKAFKPHVTLLRNMGRVPQPLPMASLIWEAHEFVLVRSVPDLHGASYEVVGRWSLGY
jgi:2'-5' RNA ligase